MKKFLLAITLFISFTLVGCSSNQVKDIPIEDIKNAINNEELLPIQPVADMDAKESFIFQNVKDKITEGFTIQAMINVKLQDVFVVKTDDVESIKKVIEDYKSDSLQLFADGYGGEENATAVSESVINSKGNYVYFIAAQNVKEIEAKILEMIE